MYGVGQLRAYSYLSANCDNFPIWNIIWRKKSRRVITHIYWRMIQLNSILNSVERVVLNAFAIGLSKKFFENFFFIISNLESYRSINKDIELYSLSATSLKNSINHIDWNTLIKDAEANIDRVIGINVSKLWRINVSFKWQR